MFASVATNTVAEDEKLAICLGTPLVASGAASTRDVSDRQQIAQSSTAFGLAHG